MPEKQRIAVRIMNRDFTVLSTESAEYVHLLAGMVDQRMRQIELSTGFGADRVGVLAALNYADEMYKLKEQTDKELRELRSALEKAKQTPLTTQKGPGPNNGGGGYNAGRNKPRKQN